MEQDPSTDLIAKQKSGRRYASKAFTQFKKPIELSRGYEMYTADPRMHAKTTMRNERKRGPRPVSQVAVVEKRDRMSPNRRERSLI
jgi:hypothetical protein